LGVKFLVMLGTVATMKLTTSAKSNRTWVWLTTEGPALSPTAFDAFEATKSRRASDTTKRSDGSQPSRRNMAALQMLSTEMYMRGASLRKSATPMARYSPWTAQKASRQILSISSKRA
jgi:hypothetical protein